MRTIQGNGSACDLARFAWIITICAYFLTASEVAVWEIWAICLCFWALHVLCWLFHVFFANLSYVWLACMLNCASPGVDCFNCYVMKRADGPRGSVLAIKKSSPVNSAQSLWLSTYTVRRTFHFISFNLSTFSPCAETVLFSVCTGTVQPFCLPLCQTTSWSTAISHLLMTFFCRYCKRNSTQKNQWWPLRSASWWTLIFFIKCS